MKKGTNLSRRIFIQKTGFAGGGLVLGFSWLASCDTKSAPNGAKALAESWYEMNAFLKIGDNGLVTIFSPNPEGGQNVKTSMPMIVAEELDVSWSNVLVEQAPLDTDKYNRQFIGGSQAIRQSWNNLRKAGATARKMLMAAAADTWQVAENEITVINGVLHHKASGKSAGYGEMASIAAAFSVPKNVELKPVTAFSIIGNSKKNVDGKAIVTGKPLFGVDTYVEGMLTAMIVHPPAFGMALKSFDAETVKKMPGIRDVFSLKVLEDDYLRQHFDTCTFLEVVAIVGDTTWQVMTAKKAIQINWQPFDTHTEERQPYGGEQQTMNIPAGLESTADHLQKMAQAAQKAVTVRKDGRPEAAFKNAAKIVEATYTAPFLAHNCMEPMNFFADVKKNSAQLSGPLQKPEFTEKVVSARLGIPLENIHINMTRLGGGYGRRSYSHWAVEAALISQRMQQPVKLVYSREDDMTGGIYRPMYQASYRAALDSDNQLIGFHVKAGGIPESPLYENRFPAGAVEHYWAQEWNVASNISIGSFRAPRSNFMASAEQSFLDEVAEAAGKDPIEFRLELLERAKKNPVGNNNDYDPERYAGVLKLVREKSNWKVVKENTSVGVSAYYCHNSYAAQVVELSMVNDQPMVDRVTCGIDCGIVINPDAAANLCEGGIVDGIGTVLHGELTFEKGVPQAHNFDGYRMIRMKEAPKNISVHFVENHLDPTGLGEPTYPPIFAAMANAMYQATGKRPYQQPFLKNKA